MTAEEIAKRLVSVAQSDFSVPYFSWAVYIGNYCLDRVPHSNRGLVETWAGSIRHEIANFLAPLLEQVRTDTVREALAAPLPGLLSEEDAAKLQLWCDSMTARPRKLRVARLLDERRALLRLLHDLAEEDPIGVKRYQAGYQTGYQAGAHDALTEAMAACDTLKSAFPDVEMDAQCALMEFHDSLSELRKDFKPT